MKAAVSACRRVSGLGSVVSPRHSYGSLEWTCRVPLIKRCVVVYIVVATGCHPDCDGRSCGSDGYVLVVRRGVVVK